MDLNWVDKLVIYSAGNSEPVHVIPAEGLTPGSDGEAAGYGFKSSAGSPRQYPITIRVRTTVLLRKQSHLCAEGGGLRQTGPY